MSGLDDPRVFFAAERTLLAWHRTGVALMAFGFVLERFGLLLHLMRGNAGHAGRDLSFWIGVAFIALGLSLIGLSLVQFRRVVKTLKPAEIPAACCAWSGVAAGGAVVALGLALLAYLFSEL